MCVVSMVMDHYKERFPPDWWPEPEPRPWIIAPSGGDVDWTQGQKTKTVTMIAPVTDEMQKLVEEMRRLIHEFKVAVKAAKLVDRLTSQPDCEDPEKVRLEERVAELELRLKALEPPTKPSRQGSVRRIMNPHRTKMI